MSAFVLDASTALSWCIPDEMTPYTLAIFDLLRDRSAIVPTLWHLEVANSLFMATRRKRITETDLLAAKSTLGILKLETDTARQLSIAELFELMTANDLTAYDATYFELASRMGLPLATQDVKLLAAARRHGIPVLP